MATGAKHDRRIRKSKPIPIVRPQAINQLPHERMLLLCHQKAIRKANRMGCWSQERELGQRCERSKTVEVHVEDYACVKSVIRSSPKRPQRGNKWHTSVVIKYHIPERINSLDWKLVSIPHRQEFWIFLRHEASRIFIRPSHSFPSRMQR